MEKGKVSILGSNQGEYMQYFSSSYKTHVLYKNQIPWD